MSHPPPPPPVNATSAGHKWDISGTSPDQLQVILSLEQKQVIEKGVNYCVVGPSTNFSFSESMMIAALPADAHS